MHIWKRTLNEMEEKNIYKRFKDKIISTFLSKIRDEAFEDISETLPTRRSFSTELAESLTSEEERALVAEFSSKDLKMNRRQSRLTTTASAVAAATATDNATTTAAAVTELPHGISGISTRGHRLARGNGTLFEEEQSIDSDDQDREIEELWDSIFEPIINEVEDTGDKDINWFSKAPLPLRYPVEAFATSLTTSRAQSAEATAAAGGGLSSAPVEKEYDDRILQSSRVRLFKTNLHIEPSVSCTSKSLRAKTPLVRRRDDVWTAVDTAAATAAMTTASNSYDNGDNQSIFTSSVFSPSVTTTAKSANTMTSASFQSSITSRRIKLKKLKPLEVKDPLVKDYKLVQNSNNFTMSHAGKLSVANIGATFPNFQN